jgi:hypothetical protein
MSQPAEHDLVAADIFRSHLDALPGVSEGRTDIRERAWVDDWKPEPED